MTGPGHRPYVTGKKRSNVGLEQFSVSVPEGVYREMMELIDRERKWDGRVEFTREAIREKLERHRRKLSPPEETSAAVRRL